MSDDITTTPRDATGGQARDIYTGTPGGPGSPRVSNTTAELAERERLQQSSHANAPLHDSRHGIADGGSLYGRAWGWSGANDTHRH